VSEVDRDDFDAVVECRSGNEFSLLGAVDAPAFFAPPQAA
jgi:hypothetical protein